MGFEELEKVLEGMDKNVRYCEICHTPFKPKTCQQKCCSSAKCQAEKMRRYQKRYHEEHGEEMKEKYRDTKRAYQRKYREQRKSLRNLANELDQEIEKTDRQVAFDNFVKEHGWEYGRLQAQKTLAMVEPIKLTLDEPKKKGDKADAESTCDNQ